MPSNCHIIGVLDSGSAGMTPAALQLIQQADLLIGNDRTLRLFANEIKPDTERKDLTGCLKEIPNWISFALEQEKAVVVLATGDPLCHGIGRYLIGKLGLEKCCIIPNTSILQLAFARLGLAWQEAQVCSIHGKDTGEWDSEIGLEHGLYALLHKIRQQKLLAIFTSPENSPSRIARMLDVVSLGDQYEIAVAERLLLPDGQLYDFMPIETVKQQQFANPNMVILRPTSAQPAEQLFGLTDEQYQQRKPDRGLITKREVRAVSLAHLQLRRDAIVWDIGAGSGSVGMEAARLCPDGYIFAIEKNSEDAAIIRQNQQQFKLTNYRLTQAKAPEGLEAWPAPDAIFIGGSGGELEQLIGISMSRLKSGGRLVMNFITLENMQTAIEQLKKLNVTWQLCQLQVSHNRPILAMQRLQAETPVWIISAEKGNQ
ncbi:MAG: precorrin-6y C5,15-methyltransferase (decarboxylating) subunit CbiE [Candidatus Polarisedimenticolaceae bacterium]|nr:precorrin-6y C5,15-methyltransferase (decarboxylating) subunit CbiE [Candidatus Polarisedimenticolaceae bacterium]